MRNNKEITTPYADMRIKAAHLAPCRRQRSFDSLYQWLKGKIIEVPNDDTVVISIKSRRMGRIERMMCFCNKETGTFRKIIRQL